jgi:hypothetical protein
MAIWVGATMRLLCFEIYKSGIHRAKSVALSKHASRHTTSSSFISNCYYSENECILKIFDLKIYIFSLCLKYYICYIIYIAVLLPAQH